MIDEAVKRAEKYDTALAFTGLTDYVESEGCDRENMRLPENQLALMGALIKTGKTIRLLTKKRKMAVIFGSVDAFALIVAIVVVCCVSHFVGFPECVGVKNTTIRRRKYTSNTTESIFTEKRSCRKANRRQSVLR